MKDIVLALIAAVIVLAICGLVFEGCDRRAAREQEKKMSCIDKADNAAEAVLCRGRVSN